jgi:hypothetical protein
MCDSVSGTSLIPYLPESWIDDGGNVAGGLVTRSLFVVSVSTIQNWLQDASRSMPRRLSFTTRPLELGW